MKSLTKNTTKKLFFTILLISLFISAPIHAHGHTGKRENLFSNWSGEVISVHDGDSITVLNLKKRKIKIRIYGIDCPELKQSYGKKAKNFTSKMVLKKIVYIREVAIDRYKRRIAWVNIGKKKGKCLGTLLLKNGLAWHYKKYSKDKKLSSTCQKAKVLKVGLWSQKNPLPPWDYRKLRRKVKM